MKIDFLEKIKNFSLLDYLLKRKVGHLKHKILFKKELVVYYLGEIAEANQIIKESNKEIIVLEDNIIDLESQIKNIKSLWENVFIAIIP